MQRVGPVEFLGWQFKIMKDQEDRVRERWDKTPSDHYGAQTAFLLHLLLLQVGNLFAKTPVKNTLKEQDFLIKFELRSEQRKEEASPNFQLQSSNAAPVEEDDWREREKRSVFGWCQILGLNAKDVLCEPPTDCPTTPG